MQVLIISALSKEGLDTLTERYLAQGYEVATEVFKHGGYWGVGVVLPIMAEKKVLSVTSTDENGAKYGR